jgi:hypothetical protein
MASKDKGRRETKKPKAKKAKGTGVPTTTIMPPQKPATGAGGAASS